jgi:hypothetical protein
MVSFDVQDGATIQKHFDGNLSVSHQFRPNNFINNKIVNKESSTAFDFDFHASYCRALPPS